MATIRETFELHIEIEDDKLPAAIAQASAVVSQIMLPHTLVQVFHELPETAQVALQLPNFAVQKTALLEQKNG